MLVIPNSRIILLKNPIEIDYLNELTFSTKQAQYNYFSNLPSLEAVRCSYQRKDEILRFPTTLESNHVTYEDLIQYNYCMYQNTSYDDKWFYAFITDVTYDNDGMCHISLETDVWQTWMFDITFKQSFVEREHVNDDTIGKHTIPEGLETGEYVCSSKTSLFTGGNSVYIIITCTKVPTEINVNNYIAQYGGIYSGTVALCFNNDDGGLLSASKFIRVMDSLDMGNAITGIYLAPQSLCGTVTFNTITIDGKTFQYGTIPYTTSYTTLTTTSNITKPSTLNGYTPKNNKLWVHPYNYFYVSNNVGMDVEFRYEDFVSNTASFKTIGSLTPGCSIKCIPLNYKLLSDNSTLKSYNYGIMI